jgi:hypothetical protein
MQRKAQSYMGKSPSLKGFSRLYGGLWCLFSARADLPSQRVSPNRRRWIVITLPDDAAEGDMARIA